MRKNNKIPSEIAAGTGIEFPDIAKLAAKLQILDELSERVSQLELITKNLLNILSPRCYYCSISINTPGLTETRIMEHGIYRDVILCDDCKAKSNQIK